MKAFPAQQPTLETNRLLLRPFNPDDADRINELVGDKAVAKPTLAIPHPYSLEDALEWLDTHKPDYESGENIVFAITLKHNHELIGAINIRIREANEMAEIGYWIGKPYWNNGYGTEALGAILKFGFEVLELNRIYASHIEKNLASGKVMAKNGMKYEGCLRCQIKKDGHFENLIMYGLLRDEFPQGNS